MALPRRLKHYRLFERHEHPKAPYSIDREVPRCIASCPVDCNVKEYVGLIARGKHDEAYSLIKERVPFPGILGRVCHHPCEQNCMRGFFDEPISVASLKRFVADSVKNSEKFEAGKGREGKVAIIGSGPAGLTAAIDLAKMEHEPVIFEGRSEIGGWLRFIPKFKLPEDVLDEELQGKLEEHDVEVNHPVDAEEFRKLRDEFDAILVVPGLHMARSLPLKGADLKNVYTFSTLIKKASSGEGIDIGREVVVIGGGNVAVDAARSAIRMGAEKVTMVCLESWDEMPTFEWERDHALEENIIVYPSWGPDEILGKEEVEDIRLKRCTAVFDEEGRFSPKFDEDVKSELPADSVIFAIGQASDVDFLDGTDVKVERGLVKVDPLTLATDDEGIFAAGDVIRGPSSVVEAIADGHRVAESIDRFLRGVDMREKRILAKMSEGEPQDEIERMKEDLKLENEKLGTCKEARKEMPGIEIEKRKKTFEEIGKGLKESSALEEAERCLSCRRCYVAPTPPNGGEEMETEKFLDDLVMETKVTKCLECGECTPSCPVASVVEEFSPRSLSAKALVRTKETVEELMKERYVWLCNTCGICESVCKHKVNFSHFVRGLRKISQSEGYIPKFSEAGLLVTKEITAGSGPEWITKGLEVAKESDVYYFSGCVSYLNRAYEDRRSLRLLEIARSAVKTLNNLGVTPVVSDGRTCCGHDLLWSGGGGEMIEELARSNVEAVEKSGAEVVVFSCPECLLTFKQDYKEILGNLEFKAVHISEFLLDREEDLEFRGPWEREILTYHDSCRLKHLGIYDEPRRILEKIPNVRLKEMEHSREMAPCCGVNAMITCNPVAKLLEVERLKEAKKVNASKLIVPCPKCWIHLDCAISSNPSIGNGLDVEEFTTFMADHLVPR